MSGKLLANKKKIALHVLGYFIIGYVVVVAIYLLSNPGYLLLCPPSVAQYKCPSIPGLIGSLAARIDFWLEVAAWPLTVIFYLVD